MSEVLSFLCLKIPEVRNEYKFFSMASFLIKYKMPLFCRTEKLLWRAIVRCSENGIVSRRKISKFETLVSGIWNWKSWKLVERRVRGAGARALGVSSGAGPCALLSQTLIEIQYLPISKLVCNMQDRTTLTNIFKYIYAVKRD